jgi:hypothetical protein
MKPSRRALIASTFIEGVGVLLFIAYYSFGQPSAIYFITEVLHRPANEVLHGIRSYRFFTETQSVVAAVLLQWLFWFTILTLAFFFVDIWRKDAKYWRHRN